MLSAKEQTELAQAQLMQIEIERILENCLVDGPCVSGEHIINQLSLAGYRIVRDYPCV